MHVLAAQRRYPCVWWSQAAQARRRAQVTRSVIVLSQFQSKIDDALHVEFGAYSCCLLATFCNQVDSATLTTARPAAKKLEEVTWLDG